jgi:hypothetical protein
VDDLVAHEIEDAPFDMRAHEPDSDGHLLVLTPADRGLSYGANGQNGNSQNGYGQNGVLQNGNGQNGVLQNGNGRNGNGGPAVEDPSPRDREVPTP